MTLVPFEARSVLKSRLDELNVCHEALHTRYVAYEGYKHFSIQLVPDRAVECHDTALDVKLNALYVSQLQVGFERGIETPGKCAIARSLPRVPTSGSVQLAAENL